MSCLFRSPWLMLIDFQMFNYCNWFMICIIKMYFLSFPGKFLKKWSNQIQKNELILNWLNLLILFPLPKKCVAYYSKLCILNFPALRHCSAVESADSKQNAISKSLFQDSFRHIMYLDNETNASYFLKNRPLIGCRNSSFHDFSIWKLCNICRDTIILFETFYSNYVCN